MDSSTVPEQNIYGANRHETYNRTRYASRAVIVRDGNILLSHETREDQWMIPGGGREAGESDEECCVREAEEETGLKVRALYPLLILNEFYENYRFVSSYFVCEVIGEGQMHLTDREVRIGAQPEWIPLDEAYQIFSHHQDWAATMEERRGLYLREFTALSQFIHSYKLF